MYTKERDADNDNDFVQRFWADPENVKQFRQIETETKEKIESLLSRGSVSQVCDCVTTVEQGIACRKAVGMPIYKFKGSR